MGEGGVHGGPTFKRPISQKGISLPPKESSYKHPRQLEAVDWRSGEYVLGLSLKRVTPSPYSSASPSTASKSRVVCFSWSLFRLRGRSYSAVASNHTDQRIQLILPSHLASGSPRTVNPYLSYTCRMQREFPSQRNPSVFGHSLPNPGWFFFGFGVHSARLQAARKSVNGSFRSFFDYLDTQALSLFNIDSLIFSLAVGIGGVAGTLWNLPISTSGYRQFIGRW